MHKILILLLIAFSLTLRGQSNLMNTNFRSPVDFDMYLSGTFAELRGGHFHAGIDIKTYEQVGKAIKMIEDGYISRIKISRYGYGKAIYVNHTNGYTSVYGHLDGFNRTISAYVEKIQLGRQQYEFDVQVPKDVLFYKKGNIIAYSGNSGYSFGPHIHFEIRETDSQKPVNPLFFGYDVKDNLAPMIRGLKVYNDFSYSALRVKKTSPGNYHLADNDTLEVSNCVSFGIDAIDMLNGAPNRNGVYSVRLLKNDTLVFHWKADHFSFYETRYINALIDYAEYVESGRKYLKTERLPNNKLSMYELVTDDGIYCSAIGDTTKWSYEIKDVKGNLSQLSFVTCTDSAQLAEPVNEKPSYRLNPFDAATVLFKNLKIGFERNSFYETVSFDVKEKPADSLLLSYKVGDRYIPVHRYYSLTTDSLPLPDTLKSKAVWVVWDERDSIFEAVSTVYSQGVLKGRTRTFGWYAVKADTIAPSVEWPVKQTPWENGDKFRIHIEDDLSGIDSYNLYVDDAWVIAEYDAKNDQLIYTIPEDLSKGKHTFECKLSDEKNNHISEQMEVFIR